MLYIENVRKKMYAIEAYIRLI
ncbi:hypothetical protein KL86CLO1_12598 [uncultured Eubacteriales bacterium]|uniref:Uncharacterized protein n=1 Tax=uncultured Eubacteriales bacterium TaxID=172733 RepID=A0A212KCD5_9FIRM|nr:hypothetical protein KL86CLO1_12598 [uncultured Eubacteriales bacterium]